jgi:general secretion pathway protein L
VDAAQQMRGKMKELRDRGRLIGAGNAHTPLAVLQEISRQVPAEIVLDIRDLNYTPESVRMEGITSSFDAINQIARGLERSPLFAQAQISDAKMSADGSRVDFRLNLVYREGGESR